MPSYVISAVLTVGGLLALFLFGGFLVLILPVLLLAAWETTEMRRQGSGCSSGCSSGWRRLKKSKLCVGRVWHTRFHPKRHAFTYPIFMFALDLEESFGNLLWPILRFQSLTHHLKNGEGTLPSPASPSSIGIVQDGTGSSLAQRVLNLVATKTQNQFQPTLTTHQIILLTHLEYFGYNFNPVSFYYLVNKSTNVLDAIVGEVSNTPWAEMYCYVLHPDSIDRVRCQEKVTSSSSLTISSTAHEYRFPKEFHVSPFMEMEYWYDWTFQGIPGQFSRQSNSSTDDDFVVINSLRRRAATTEETLDFTATLRLTAQPITPWAVAWQMIRFPVFCLVIQIWIHYQAAWLFWNGVVYVPHPQGTETVASKTIGAIMTPLFAIQDYLRPPKSRSTTTTSSSSSTSATKED